MRYGWLIVALSVTACGGGFNRKNKEGAELYREGKLDEALAAFTRAQVQSPDAPEIHYNIGNVHYRKEEMDKAVEEYRAALSGSEAVQQYANYNEGNVHFRGQDFPGAIEAYKKALKIDADDVEARQNLELALQQQEEQSGGGGGGGGESEDDNEEQQDKQPQSQDQQEQQQQQQEQSEQNQQQNPAGMSQEEAERILAALAEMEKAEQQRQQEKKKARVRGKKKDW